MEQKRLSETAENVIAFVIAAIVIAGIILGFGWTSVKAWIDGPLVWRESKVFSISYDEVQPSTKYDSELLVYFDVTNDTDIEIDDYEILVEFGDSIIELDSLYSGHIKPGYGTIGVTAASLCSQLTACCAEPDVFFADITVVCFHSISFSTINLREG